MDLMIAGDILGRGSLAYLAVTTGRGPHLTPLVYGVSHQRIWMVSARDTVKVRSIRRHPEVAVVVRDGERGLSVSGTAEIISPLGLRDVANLVGAAPVLPFALFGYGLRNASLMGGYALDMLGAFDAATPLNRVILSVEQTRGVLTEGEELTRRWGRWSGTTAPPERGEAKRGAHRSAQAADLLGRAPNAIAHAVGPDVPVVVAWESRSGPKALPAEWSGDPGTALVPAAALRAMGIEDGAPACLTYTTNSGPRPSRVAGAMLRGRVQVGELSEAWARFEIQPDRVSWWQGFKAGTIEL